MNANKNILLVFLMLCSADVFSQSAVAPADSIISIKNMRSKQDSARMDEVVAIEIRTSRPLRELTVMYIDGMRVDGFAPIRISEYEKTVYFKLNTKIQDVLEQYLQRNSVSTEIVPVYLSLGNKTRPLVSAKLPLYVEVRQDIHWGWVVLIIVVIAGVAVTALFKNVLKDDNNLYYSLSRSQMFYWTILIVVAYVHICLTTGVLPAIPDSVLAILGISIGTTAAAKLIENRNREGVTIDHNARSEGWFVDILSDGSSINIQRLQNVIFNLLFGIIFIQRTLSTHLMPDFDNTVLLLMGISSGAYAGLKITEATKEQSKTPPPVGTDVKEEKDLKK